MNISPTLKADEHWYASFTELRTAHHSLLRIYWDDSESSAFLIAANEFVQRGRATGAVLDNEDDRRSAQSMLDYWATTLYTPGLVPLNTTLADFDTFLLPELDELQCPYLGLDAFGENQSHLFFGRQRKVKELVELLATSRLIIVVGRSGSGKSSLVRGGLIPALKANAVPGSADWHFFPSIVPGSDPLASLCRLLPSLKTDGKAQLREHSDTLVDAIDAAEHVPALLVVDQFEEVFTLCEDVEARQAFINNLVTLVTTSGVRHTVILTLRSDFEGYLTRIPSIEDQFGQFEDILVQVLPLSASELREAIEKPAERVGLKFESGVIDSLVQEMLGEEAALPLLQFTLLKLWEKRNRNRVTFDIYDEVGRGREALARSADAFYDKLIPEDQDTARRMLLSLVRVNESLEATSSRIQRELLYRTGEDPRRINSVLQRLIDERLVRVTLGDTSADDQVEVAHEALVRNWPRLVSWINDERIALRQRRRLTDTAEQWQLVNRDSSALLRGTLLTDVAKYTDLNDLEEAFIAASQAAERAEREEQERVRRQQYELEQAQIVASEKSRAARNGRLAALGFAIVAILLFIGIILLLNGQTLRQAADRERNANATAQAARLDADYQRSLAETAAVAAVAQQAIAQQAATEAVAQQGTAQAERARAERAAQSAQSAESEANAQRLAFQAQVQGEGSETGLLLAYEAAGRNHAPAVIQTLRDLLDQETGVSSGVITSTIGAQLSIASDLTHNRQRLLVANAMSSGITLYTETGIETGRMAEDVPNITRIVVSPSGNYIGALSRNSLTALVFNRRGVLLHRLRDTSTITSMAFSPDNAYLVTGNTRGSGTVWDTASGRKVFTLSSSHNALIYGVAFGPKIDIPVEIVATNTMPVTADGVITPTVDSSFLGTQAVTGTNNLTTTRTVQYIATASEDRDIRLWNAADGSEVMTLKGNSTIWDVAFSPDGHWLASVSSDPVVRMWDVFSGRLSIALKGHTGTIYRVMFSADGQRLITASIDHTARVWDVQTGQLLSVLDGHTLAVKDVGFGFAPNQIITAADDGSVRLWSLTSQQILKPLTGHTNRVRDAAYSFDGRAIVTGGDDGVIRVWDSFTSVLTKSTALNTRVDITSVAYSHKATMSKYIITGSTDSTSQIWDSTTLAQLAVLEGNRKLVRDATFSPDDTLVATASEDGYVRIWQVGSEITAQTQPTLLRELHHADSATVWSVAFSDDSEHIVSAGNDGKVIVWNVMTGIQEAVLDHRGVPVQSAAFSADGHRVVTGATDQHVRVWETSTEQVVRDLIGHTGDIWHVEYSPNGQYILSTSSDQTARLWDATSGEIIAILRGHTGSVLNGMFSSDGQRIVTASVDATVRQHLLSPDDLLKEAACRVGRELSDSEIESFAVPLPRMFTLTRRACPPIFNFI